MEIQSSTLERLLEALDVRHLAGWYHPAMRLQGHLNVVQGSNSELRGQLKQLRYFRRNVATSRSSFYVVIINPRSKSSKISKKKT